MGNIPLKREANRYFSKPITALLPYFTSGNEKFSTNDVKAFCEVLGNACKSSEKFSCFGGYNFIKGQNFSKISSVIYISTYYLCYIKK